MPTLKLAGTEFNLKYSALEIYISGCRHHPCKGCHNSELWDATVGDSISNPKVSAYLEGNIRNSMVRNIWILGGEPTDDMDSLLGFVKWIRCIVKDRKNIWLWTHREIEDIAPSGILYYLDWVKTGMYKDDGEPYEETHFHIRLANREQKLWKINRNSGETA